MEFVACDVDRSHVLLGYSNAFRIGVGVELAAHGQAGVGSGGADQVDYDAVADQRPGAPVDADEREQPVLDLVPLAGAGRMVARS